MGTLKATCHDCGPVHIFPDEIELVVCNLPSLSHYSFPCPQCKQTVVKRASDAAIATLLGGNVKPTMWEVPAEAAEPKPGPALTYDDLLDFALQLGESDTLAENAMSGARANQL